MKKIIYLIIVVLVLTACNSKNSGKLVIKELKEIEETEYVENKKVTCTEKRLIINIDGESIASRFEVPEGFDRVDVEEGSFQEYLRNLPLKSYDSCVKYYNGKTKINRDVYLSVVDMEIGDRDLQQCADAVMRLRGEYLYGAKMYDEIHFNLTNGFRMDYRKWMEGNRLVVEGNNTYWDKRANESNSYESFRNYMDIVFSYAGTLSLSKELEEVAYEDIRIGDVFIQGGSPGHAVIIVDMAENLDTGKKCYIMAQSYMPAQDIQILKNQDMEYDSPWYFITSGEIIRTPEWSFTRNDLKRFDD